MRPHPQGTGDAWTRHVDYLVTLPHDARIGVVRVWLVDVDERTACAHRLDSERSPR
jgi:hypothetical protein